MPIKIPRMDLHENYSPPQAEIRGETPRRARYLFPLLTAIWAPVGLALILEVLLQVFFEQSFLLQTNLRVVVLLALIGGASGASVIHVNQLRWYWALVLGPVLAIGWMLIFALILGRVLHI